MLPQRPMDEYATKADLQELRRELKSDLQELRLEMRAALAELKADIRKDITDLQRTVIIAMVGLTGIFGGLVTILKLFA